MFVNYEEQLDFSEIRNSSISSGQEQDQMENLQLGQVSMIIGKEEMKEQEQDEDKKFQRQVMEQNKQQCPICFVPFDDKAYTPMMVCQKNQHLCCKDCVPNLFQRQTIKCPICRILINKKDVTVFRLYGEYIQKVIVLKSSLREKAKVFEDATTQKSHLKNELKETIEKTAQKVSLLNNDLQTKEECIISLKKQIMNKANREEQIKQRIEILGFELQTKRTILESKELIIAQQLSEMQKLQKKTQNLQFKAQQLQVKIQNLQLKIQSLKRNIQELNQKYDKNDTQKQKLIVNQQQKSRLLQQQFEQLQQKLKRIDLQYNDKIGKVLLLNEKQVWQERGHSYIKSGKIQVAYDLFTHLIEKNIEDQEEIYGFGCVQDLKGYFQNREQELYFGLVDSQKLKPNPFDALALCYLKNKNYRKAKAWYEQMLQSRPPKCQLLFGLANTLYNLNEYSEAERVYREIIALRPAMDKPYQLLASLYFSFGSAERNAQTRLLCRDSLAINPQNLYSQFMLSALEENPQTKETQLLGFVERERQFVRAKSALASHYISLKLFDKGVQLSKECIAANPFYDRPYLSLGFVHQSRQFNHLALEEYRSCLQKNPQSENAYLHLGRLYLKLGNLDRALSSLQKALEINASFLRGCEVLAKAHFMKGDIKRCIEYYEKCALLSQQKEKYFESIGDLFYFNLENPRKAKQYYEKCSDQNPKNKQASSQLIIIRKQQKKY